MKDLGILVPQNRQLQLILIGQIFYNFLNLDKIQNLKFKFLKFYNKQINKQMTRGPQKKRTSCFPTIPPSKKASQQSQMCRLRRIQRIVQRMKKSKQNQKWIYNANYSQLCEQIFSLIVDTEGKDVVNFEWISQLWKNHQSQGIGKYRFYHLLFSCLYRCRQTTDYPNFFKVKNYSMRSGLKTWESIIKFCVKDTQQLTDCYCEGYLSKQQWITFGNGLIFSAYFAFEDMVQKKMDKAHIMVSNGSADWEIDSIDKCKKWIEGRDSPYWDYEQNWIPTFTDLDISSRQFYFRSLAKQADELEYEKWEPLKSEI